MVLLGTEDARFVLATEELRMGVSGTKIAKNGVGEALWGRGLGGIWSDKV